MVGIYGSDDSSDKDLGEYEGNAARITAIHLLGVLYKSPGKLDASEQMYQPALQGRENALDADHRGTLRTIND